MYVRSAPPTPGHAAPVVVLLFVVTFAGACATLGPVATPGSGDGGTGIEIAAEELQLRSLLLLMVDQQRFEPLTVESALTGSPALRDHLALTLGRVGSSRGVSYLNQLLADAEPSVRRAAAFALGELTLERPDAETAARSLLVAAVDPDRRTGRLAIEALGKLGVSVTEVAGALTAGDMDEGERWARLLPSLFRFDEEASVPLAAGGLELAPGDELRRWAAYALTRAPRPAALPEIRRLAGDPDPRVRAWAARALGLVGSVEDLSLLVPLLGDTDPAPPVQALRAGAALVETGGAVDGAARRWLEAHVRLLDDPRPHVRLEALDRAGPWLAVERELASERATAQGSGPAMLAPAVRARLGDEEAAAPERAAALGALTAVPAPQLAGVVGDLAEAADPRLRAAAARAAGRLAGTEIPLQRFLADSAAVVRTAAAETAVERLGEVPDPPATEVVRRLLRVDDAGVRAVTFGWLGDHPVLGYEELTRTTRAALVEGNVETLLAAVDALAARGVAVPEERGGVVAVLERLAARREWRLRRGAADALAELDRPAPPVGHPNLRRTPDLYEEIVQRTARPRTVEVSTDAGTFRVRLDCPTAPLTCLNFLQLVGQGYFDGLTFHRVVPDFVVQGGDPRGDGYGGPGYTIRDETGPTRYTRGVLGMALAGAHTAGSQFFLTLSPQPHLDGAYTAFGHVEEGLPVLDRITRGTRILSVVEVAAPER